MRVQTALLSSREIFSNINFDVAHGLQTLSAPFLTRVVGASVPLENFITFLPKPGTINLICNRR